MQALLERGADASLRDEFGHTAWDHALSRACEDATFAPALGAVAAVLAPYTLDVQTGGRLVRLSREQGEYWLLSFMLAGLKTQYSQCVTMDLPVAARTDGFFADQLHGMLESLPEWLWPAPRRKRTYVNQVLARAEVSSSYRPARQLWMRARAWGTTCRTPRCCCGIAMAGVTCTRCWRWTGWRWGIAAGLAWWRPLHEQVAALRSKLAARGEIA